MADIGGAVNRAVDKATTATSNPSGYDRTAFAKAVLQAIGAPASQGNVTFLLSWFAREGTRAAFNPLATTLNYGTNTKFNGVGVRNYADFNTGVQATARTLQGYPGIVNDLRADNGRGAASNHPDEFRKWSGGGYTSIAYGAVGDTLGGPAASSGSGGGGGGATSAPGLPPNASPQQIEQYIRENYPQTAGYLDIPEIRTILIQAAQEQWTPTKLQAAIQATDWWRTHSSSARDYFNAVATDPATAEQMVGQKMAEIAPMLSQTGLNIGDLHAYAENALKYGLTTDQIQQDINRKLHAQSQGTGLQENSSPDAIADRLQAMARTDYFVPLNRLDVENWAVDIYSGLRTEDQFRDYLSSISSSRFPGIAQQGITPGEYMAPIRNTVADILELQPGDVDLLNPKWSALLQVPGNDGVSRPMTIAEAQKWARSLPEYQYTKGAGDSAAAFGEALAQRFGAVA